MIAWLFKLLNPVAAITKEIAQWRIEQAHAEVAERRIEADEVIAELKLKQELLIKEQGSAMTRWIRPAFAFPFVVYNSKVLIWDKSLGLGSTDPISPEFWQLQMIVFSAYFVTRGIEKTFKR